MQFTRLLSKPAVVAAVLDWLVAQPTAGQFERQFI
jgi:hypothetical protein